MKLCALRMIRDKLWKGDGDGDGDTAPPKRLMPEISSGSVDGATVKLDGIVSVGM